MVLVCNDRPAASATVAALRDYSNPLSLVRLARLHGTGNVMRETLLTSDEWLSATERLRHGLDVPALKLDAAFVHVNKADVRGVCQINSPDHHMDDWFVRAAEKAFVSTEELVDTEYFHDQEFEKKLDVLLYWSKNKQSLSTLKRTVHLEYGFSFVSL